MENGTSVLYHIPNVGTVDLMKVAFIYDVQSVIRTRVVKTSRPFSLFCSVERTVHREEQYTSWTVYWKFESGAEHGFECPDEEKVRRTHADFVQRWTQVKTRYDK